MKKIVINGGEFYKAFLVASFENVSLSANTFLTLLPKVKADTMYRLEVTRSTSSNLDVYNNAYIVTSLPYDYESDAVFTARINDSTKPLLLKCDVDLTISVKVYECKKFVGFKVPIVGDTAYSFIVEEQVSEFQLPKFVSGRKYKVKVTPLYSGQFTFYQTSERYNNDNVVENTTYEFEYTASSGAKPMIRNYVAGTQYVIIEINIVE